MISPASRLPANLPVRILIVIASIAVGAYIGIWGISYREVMYFAGAMAIGVLIVKSANAPTFGLYCWIATLAVGFRTIQVYETLRLFATELVLIVVFMFLLIIPLILKQPLNFAKLPRWMWIFALFCLWGWLPWSDANQPWFEKLSEFRCFALLVPLFLLSANVIRSESTWNTVIKCFFYTEVFVAVVGLLEYQIPGIDKILPGFANNMTFVTETGFNRASFSFWGSPDAAYGCLLVLPFAAYLWKISTSKPGRIILSLCVLSLLFAIYISGHRDAWFFLVIELFVFAVISRRPTIAFIIAVGLSVLYTQLPQQTLGRIDTISGIASGNTSDSSGIKRLERIDEAVNTIVEHPEGIGWAEAGWVHNDFLQIAANLGLLAGITFFSAWFGTVVRLYKTSSRKGSLKSNDLGIPLLISFIVVGGLFATECTIVLPHFIMPLWFVWVLAELYIRQSRTPGDVNALT